MTETQNPRRLAGGGFFFPPTFQSASTIILVASLPSRVLMVDNPTLPPCPKCRYEFTYEDRNQFVCPECSHVWDGSVNTDEPAEEVRVWKDAHGTILQNGDTVMVIKDLKVKGAASTLKAGTKVKSIRLVHGDHDIDCKIDGFGSMGLKSEFVKKV